MRTKQPNKCFVLLKKLSAGRGWHCKTCLSPPLPVIYYRPFQGGSKLWFIFIQVIFIIVDCRMTL